jgi:hypothetical protein
MPITPETGYLFHADLHPSVMQFYSGPLMHFLSGVDTRPSDRRRRSRSCHCDKARSQLCQQSAAAAWSGADLRTQSGKCSIACRARVPAPPDLPSLGCKHDPVARHGRSSMTLPKAPVGLWSPAKRDLRFGRFARDTDDGARHGRSSWKPFRFQGFIRCAKRGTAPTSRRSADDAPTNTW